MSQPPPAASAFTEQTLDLREYIAPVWRRRWLILLLVVLAAGGAYFLARRQQANSVTAPVYSTSTEVYIEVANPTYLVGVSPSGSPNPPNGQQMSDLATLFTEQSINKAVSKALGMPVDSAGSVNISLLSTGTAATYGTSIIVVDATSSSAALAARLANTYVAQFFDSRKRAEAAAAAAQAAALNAQLTSLANAPGSASERETLRLQIAQLRATQLNPSPGAYQVSPAPPGGPVPSGSSRSPVVDAVIAGLVALLLGIGLAFGASVFDRRLRRVSGVESSYRLPVLAVLPHVSRPGRVVEGRAVIPPAFLEIFRSLRVTLRLLGEGDGMRTLVVTSALAGEGKSTVAAHLALACVEGGERVLLIDADLRRPSVASWFGVQASAGLVQVLRGETSLSDAIVPLYGATPADHGQNSNGGNGGTPVPPGARGALSVLVDGGHIDAPHALLATRAMATVLEAARKRYDTVIIDTAPVLAVADTVPMLGQADAVLLVARLGATTRDAAERLADVTSRVPEVHLVGVVANDAQDSLLGDGYAGLYSSGRRGYGYGYANRGRRSRRRSGARSG